MFDLCLFLCIRNIDKHNFSFSFSILRFPQPKPFRGSGCEEDVIVCPRFTHLSNLTVFIISLVMFQGAHLLWYLRYSLIIRLLNVIIVDEYLGFNPFFLCARSMGSLHEGSNCKSADSASTAWIVNYLGPTIVKPFGAHGYTRPACYLGDMQPL